MTALDTDERLKPGFFANQIRTNFRNLCRMEGREAARETAAQIIADELNRTADTRKDAR